MGCCSTKNDVKNSVNKKLAPIHNDSKTKGPQPNKDAQLGEKQRIDTPQVTEENYKSPRNNNDITKSIVSRGAKNLQYFDISPKVIKKNKIYHITNNFPISKPYSNQSDWQNLLKKSQSMSEEELILKILGLRNRNWIQEQIKLQIEQNSSNAGSLEGLVLSRRFIQLREHFNWILWAVAQFYFLQKFENKFNFPKFNSKSWNEGFEYKGIHIRVLPYEDAYFIHNEMQALKYVQMELLELQALAPAIQHQSNQQMGKDNIQKDVILPLLSGVSCGGFFLYGTPTIYIQELDETRNFYRDTIGGGAGHQSKIMGLQQNSIIQLPQSRSHHVVPAALNQSEQLMQPNSQVSFSYLHNNINGEMVQDSLFKFMPILKNLTQQNLIPIIDFDEFNQQPTEEQRFQTTELKYLLVNLYPSLPQLSENSASTQLLRFPCVGSEEVTMHQFPQNKYMELKEINTLINYAPSNILIDDDGGENLIFTKKFFTKHGWDFIMMQKQQDKMNLPENKRATQFFAQREDHLKTVVENKDDSKYVSPQKQTILKRMETQVDQKIMGNALVSAYNFKKEFKIQYSLNSHSYSTSIESLFSASIDQVARIIEQSDNIYNQNALKELLHRKGLNMRFLWVILTKLKVQHQRDLVMAAILVRVMRKIINEEIKLKSRVTYQVHDNHQLQVNNFGNEDAYYQGYQIDTYKEIVILFSNAILKRKFSKQKSIFDETLSGLFLSRMSVLGVLFSLNQLKREEINYLESRNILEDIIHFPSNNPIHFINAIKDYFKIDFKLDFLRICRQDKQLLLSKTQPITVNDIKSIELRNHSYFTIKENSYFMLARQITYRSKNSPQKIVSKIKTKTDKDLLKQSFQKPRNSNDISIHSQASNRHAGTTTPQVKNMRNDSSTTSEHQDSKKTMRNQNVPSTSKDQLNTIRQYQNINQNQQPIGPQRNKNEQPMIDLSGISKRNGFKPSSVQEIIMPSILYKLKTFLSNNPMYYFDDNNKTYVGDTFTVLKSYYEMPNIDIVNEWVICMESLLKDVFSVNGCEQVLLEAFVYQALLIYFFEKDLEALYKVMTKIRDTLFICNYCSPECIIMIQILTGLFFEEQKDQAPRGEAEKSYLTALMCIFSLYGDPRGRGNITIPYILYLSWKLSLLSLAEDRKLQDSEFSEEIFDACLKNLYNHRRLYREQQLLLTYQSSLKQQQQPEFIMSQFELKMDSLDQLKSHFDLAHYSKRPSFTIQKTASVVSQSISKKGPHVNINGQTQSKEEMNNIKSKSFVPLNKKGSRDTIDNELDVNEIDLEVEDENRNNFIEENFKNAEWYIGTCPFQHWSLYRQQIQQIMAAHPATSQSGVNQTVYQRQIFRDMLQKALPKDIFYQWLLKFNPIMYQSSVQWTNTQIKDNIFCQNQQMISSSSSSVVMSHQNFSHQSLNSMPTSAKERKNLRLGSYSQILGKEIGGISKQDMCGVVFTWGSDNTGQLGLDIITTQQTQPINLKVLYPRMVVSLRDEIIKEVCCGHSHTMAINITGDVYCWGLNENAQLGLGEEAPTIIRKPILNPYLKNIVKLSAGNEHSIALNKQQDLFIWGCGGLTGLGDANTRHIPTKLDFFKNQKISMAVCGGLHTIAVTKDGECYSWGSTEGGQLGLAEKMLQTLCKTKEQPVLTPQKIPLLDGKNIIQVAAGEAHTIVMDKEGKIFGWGMSNYGQLGLGFSSDSFEPGIGMEKSKVYEPTQITALDELRIQKIICGATFSLFLTSQGELFGCGMNDLGQLGLDTFMDDIRTLDKTKKGRQSLTSSDVTIPTRVICFQGIPLQPHQISCGENHALAVNGDERNMLWAWGMYKSGQLGLGEVAMKINPRPVQTLCSCQIQRVACGSMHSCALVGDSTLISTHSPQFYINNESIDNQWQMDIKLLQFQRQKTATKEIIIKE